MLEFPIFNLSMKSETLKKNNKYIFQMYVLNCANNIVPIKCARDQFTKSGFCL